jgi:hypothetical protein
VSELRVRSRLRGGIGRSRNTRGAATGASCCLDAVLRA